jgi:protein-S-isoprenylcysteine O-methyltransferase Ste14
MLFQQAVSFSVLIFFLIAFVLPLVRLWLRTGTFAMAFSRNRDPIQKIVGASIAVYMTGLCIWAGFYGVLGRAAVGVWQVPMAVESCGWVLLVMGLTLTVTAQAQMGLSWRMGVDPKPTDLITNGLFRVSRNPIYTGMLMTLASYLFISPCPWIVLGWCQFLLLVMLQTRYEEQALIKTHGQSYLSYAATVGRFYPGIGYLLPKSVAPELFFEEQPS